jgi:hypothetical protein
MKLHPTITYMIKTGAVNTRRAAQLQRAEHEIHGDWVGQIVAHLGAWVRPTERDRWANEAGGWG